MIASPTATAAAPIAPSSTGRKVSGKAGGLRERVEGVDEDLADDGGDGGREPQRDERARGRPAGRDVARGLVPAPAAPEVRVGHAEVEREQDDRDGDAEHGERVALRVAVEAGHGGGEEHERGGQNEADLGEEGVPLELRV